MKRGFIPSLKESAISKAFETLNIVVFGGGWELYTVFLFSSPLKGFELSSTVLFLWEGWGACPQPVDIPVPGIDHAPQHWPEPL